MKVEVAKRMRILRRSLNVSAAVVARRTGEHQETVTARERKGGDMPMTSFLGYCQALDISPAEAIRFVCQSPEDLDREYAQAIRLRHLLQASMDGDDRRPSLSV